MVIHFAWVLHRLLTPSPPAFRPSFRNSSVEICISLWTRTIFKANKHGKHSLISCITCICISRVTGNLAIMFARLLFQHGIGNCKKGYSTIPVDIGRVKSYVNRLFDPGCVTMWITTNKLYLIAKQIVSSLADLCGASRSSVFRIAQEGCVNKRSLGPASRKELPRNLQRQRRLITRSIITLRTEERNFSAVRIMEQAGNDNSEVLLRTVTRFLKWKRLLLFTSTQERALKRDDLFC